MTIKSTIIDNSRITFCNKNTQRYACYKNNQKSMIIFCFCSNEMQPSRIGGAKQNRYLYSVFGILHAVGGVGAERTGYRL